MSHAFQKASPTISDLHVDAALTDLSVAYEQAENRFVARKMFPVVPVKKQSDKYHEFSRADWMRSEARGRAPGAPAVLGGWGVSQNPYFCDRKAIGHPIADPERANADPAVQNLDADATRWIEQQLLLADEKDWVTNAFTTGVWDGASSSTDMTGTAAAPASTAEDFLRWSDVASTPIEDIDGEGNAVSKKTGQKPNALVLGSDVWLALKNHPDVLDRIKYTERGVITTDLLASLLDLDRVVVSFASENTAVEGRTASYSAVAGKHALLLYVPASPGLATPSAGYTFVWTGMSGTPGNGQGARIKRYRWERDESDIVEGEVYRDFKVVGASLAAFFASAVT